MKSKEPHSWSTLGCDGVATLHPRLPDFPHEPETEWTVVIWDDRPLRRQLIRRVAEQCGIRAWVINDLSELERIQCSDYCSTVVLALGTCPLPDDLSLEVIRNLKQKGFSVISYEDSALSWPIGARCRALLAGASWILDSAKAEFTAELGNILERRVQAEVVRRTEEDSL